MKAINFIGLALCIVCVVANTNILKLNTTTRILGGENAKEGQFPHQVSLRYYGQHFCGGSIISNWFILTAAHCTQGELSNPHSIQVVVGALKRTSGGITMKLAAIISHPGYDEKKIHNDISLLCTAKKIQFTNFIQPIPLPAIDLTENERNRNVLVSGWGKTKKPVENDNQELPDNLQFVGAEVLDIKSCIKRFSNTDINDYVIESNICTLNEIGVGVCQGDSGGPLIDPNDPNGKTLVGVVSWGISCGTEYPAIYTRVHSYIDWIINEMRKYGDKPEDNSSEKPTEQPTEVPTEQPTEVPTWKPTEWPTEKPTEVPIEQPTEGPTEKPTEVPTWKPTEWPTTKPTEWPTAKPTEWPTEKPTENPTEKPTEKPTEEPNSISFIQMIPTLLLACACVMLCIQSVLLYSIYKKKSKSTNEV